jgi:hypothetical protein
MGAGLIDGMTVALGTFTPVVTVAVGADTVGA